MKLAGIQKLTLLDYPGHTAATVFTPGCNFRCPFCHNADLVASDSVPTYATDDLFALLERRHGLLDGVCITGGEPLLQPDLADFCARIHEQGFDVKLDTNGSFPDRLRALIKAGLVDYVAMDVKNTPARYAETIGVPGFDPAPVRESLDLLRVGRVPYELRTTVVREFHTHDGLRELALWIAKAPESKHTENDKDGKTAVDKVTEDTPTHAAASEEREAAGRPHWFLQSFIDSEHVLGGTGRLHAWAPDDLRTLLPELQRIVPDTALRGID